MILGIGRLGHLRGESPNEDIAKRLEGNWRQGLLFVLRQEVELYRTYQEKIYECDLELRQRLESSGSKVDLQRPRTRSTYCRLVKPHIIPSMADRLLGSPALYSHKQREAEQSVNFVTCHDGFTLNDLVSYNQKHNEANGEDNRDGANDNRSWNCGVEGLSDDSAVEKLRNRQIKNFLTVTMLSLGVPMIVMGDEVRLTQLGNNNCYCLDNEISWFDWALITRQTDIFRFLKLLIARRRLRDLYPEHQQRVSLNQLLGKAKKAWHGVKLGQPDWSPWSHSLALGVHLPKEKLIFHMILNAYWELLEFELPPLGTLGGGPWRRWIDTALDSPHDIVEWNEAQSISPQSYRAGPRSVVVLCAGL